MRLLSININGVKAFYNRSVLDRILEMYDPDVIAFQETKASEYDTYYWLSEYTDYKIHTQSSKTKKGYAGVSFMIKKSLPNYSVKFTELGDNEYFSGRIIELDIYGFKIVNVYTLNSGNKEDLRDEWDELFNEYIKSINNDNLILCGDFNVCHTDLDYHDPENIDTYPGLYIFEKNNFTRLINDNNLVDTFRYFNPELRKYTWFNQRIPSHYENNKGWRLDYFLVSKNIINKIHNSLIDDRNKVSDHYMIILDINND